MQREIVGLRAGVIAALLFVPPQPRHVGRPGEGEGVRAGRLRPGGSGLVAGLTLAKLRPQNVTQTKLFEQP
jgi:hypothetical protein